MKDFPTIKTFQKILKDIKQFVTWIGSTQMFSILKILKNQSGTKEQLGILPVILLLKEFLQKKWLY